MRVFMRRDMRADPRVVAVASADLQAALAWPWFLMGLDDWGRAYRSARHWRAVIAPALDDIDAAVIDRWVDLYIEARLLHAYEVEGQACVAVLDEEWWAVQTHVHAARRDGRSRIPPMPEGETARDPAQTRANARNPAQPRAVARKRAQTPPENVVTYITRARAPERAGAAGVLVEETVEPIQVDQVTGNKRRMRRVTSETAASDATGAPIVEGEPAQQNIWRGLWAVFDTHLGKARTQSERGRRSAAVRDLVAAGCEPEQLDVAVANWRRVMGSATCTETGVASHLGRLTEGWQARGGGTDSQGRMGVVELIARWEPQTGETTGGNNVIGARRTGRLGSGSNIERGGVSRGNGAPADGFAGAQRG